MEEILSDAGRGVGAGDGGGDGGPRLRRSITSFQLATIGIGCTVGTGIFYIFSEAVPLAGPAVLISFVIAAVTAGLTALCYAELASTIPASGSSYTYTYATMGEVVAYLVGWCLVLEYTVSAAAVAVGWSQYLNDFLERVFSWRLPDALSHAPWHRVGEEVVFSPAVNLPSLVLVAMCAFLLIRGTSESARANAIMVVVKLGLLSMFAVVSFTGFQTSHFTPFAPLGVAGVGAASGLVFFTFIGLDVVSTAGEEVEDPKRALPRALIGALITVTVVYLLVAVSALGAQPWRDFAGQEAGLSRILEHVTGSGFWSIVLSAGAIISIFSITLVTIFGQTRVLFAMSRDGMVPRLFGKVDPRTLTPVRNTIVTSLAVGALAGFVPLDFLANLVSIGTLTAFTVVSIGVIVLRRREPDLERAFTVPLYPALPVASVLACLYLIWSLPPVTWLAFASWIGLALFTYTTYSYRHSTLRRRSLEEVVRRVR